jgi:pyrroline-5-carboxylate reductase
MLRTSGLPAQQLRSEVTSRAGVTQAATSYLDAHRINAEIIAAIEAAHQRAKELGKDTTTG